jgi:hypothetical protein
VRGGGGRGRKEGRRKVEGRGSERKGVRERKKGGEGVERKKGREGEKEGEVRGGKGKSKGNTGLMFAFPLTLRLFASSKHVWMF